MGIGGWRRGRIIGRGASATVSLATSLSSGEVFAVKSSALSSSASLQWEQRILSVLDSPYVVSCFGFDIAPHASRVGLCYNLLMEYAPGGSLSDEINRHGGTLDELSIRSYALDVLGGLAYLHSNGVVHCDLKSQNVLICCGGRAKIADLGCARRTNEEDDGGCLRPRGTPLFMAPEVARGEEQGAPADVWALGCTVVEMATGRPPWPRVSDPVGALHRIAFSSAVPEFPSWVSEEGKDFLSRCLRRDPGERWTAEQLLCHPFVASSTANRPKSDEDCSWVSPKSALDQVLWESTLSDEDDVLVERPLEDAFGRIQSISGGTGGGAAPNWTWDEDWATVRSDGGECSFPATDSITEEDERSTTRSSEEFIMFSTDRVEMVHTSSGHCFVNASCNLDDTSVAQVVEGIRNQLLMCKRYINNFGSDTFCLVIHKEYIPFMNKLYGCCICDYIRNDSLITNIFSPCN